MNNEIKRKKITVPDILARKSSGPRITTLTAYDYTFARLIDEAGIDIILIGDSVSSVIQGNSNTIPVTMDQMVYHTRCTTAGAAYALTVADMPFMSYQAGKERAIENAGRLLKEGGASAIKLEGGENVADIIKYISDFDIPVMGHIGLTPQSYHRMGGHKVQGKTHDQDSLKAGTYERIINDAVAVEKAGAFAVVIECVPEGLADEITKKISIPTIGIGAGVHCDGQVLVMHDMLGLEDRRKPKFVKRYAGLADIVRQAAKDYITEVQKGVYPDPEHTFKDEEEKDNTKGKSRLQLV